MSANRSDPTGTPADRLRRAWSRAQGGADAPRLAEFCAIPIDAGDAGVLELVRIDALERRRLGLPAGVRAYEASLGTIQSGSRVAEWLLAEEISDALARGDETVAQAIATAVPDRHQSQAARILDRLLRERLDSHAMEATAAVPPGVTSGGGQVSKAVPDELVGPYRLKRQIGRGGFGEVWVAQHTTLDRHVALKLIRADRLDDRTVKRFEVERESLRLLAHPNVAKIFDAGFASDGRPFIAMEYVSGQPITTYCDRRHLSLHDRLTLFAKVCDAVHYIHLQGLLHRDLSPDNVLVSDMDGVAPEPKVIDFGVAKPLRPELRLSEQTMSMELGVAVGKWLYMSPEQAEGGGTGIDARSDIYGLGVILYQLLAGVTPFDSDMVARRAIREAIDLLIHTPRPEPATRLRTLEVAVKTELATQRGEHDPEALARRLESRVRFLPLTALHVDRTRRFSSAAAMAEDIRRYLRGEDFAEARKDPYWDKALRGARRHWLPLSAVAMVLVALAGGLAAAAYGLREARAGRSAAQEASSEARGMVASLIEGLADDPTGGSGPRTRAVLTSMSDRVQSRYASNPELRAQLLSSIGAGQTRLGDTDDAERSFVAARTAAKELANADVVAALIDVHEAQILWRADRAEEALRRTEAALATLRANDSQQGEIAEALNMLGGALKHTGQLDASEKIYRESLALREAESPRDERSIAVLRHNLALVDMERGKALLATDPARAEALVRKAVEAERVVWNNATVSLGSGDPDALAPASEVGVGLIRLARLAPDEVSREALRLEAEGVYSRIADPMVKSLGATHWRTLHATASRAHVLQLLGRNEEAVVILEPTLDAFRVLRGRTSGETIAVTTYYVDACVALGRDDVAAAALRRTVMDLRAAKDDAGAEKLLAKWPSLQSRTERGGT